MKTVWKRKDCGYEFLGRNQKVLDAGFHRHDVNDELKLLDFRNDEVFCCNRGFGGHYKTTLVVRR